MSEQFVATTMTRHALKKQANMQAHALANLEKSVARAVEVGVEPRVLNETVGGSVKGALRALLDDSKAFLIAKQLYDGASDPKNPRQLDYISRLKEWTDGHETKQTRTETVSQRISLTLGGTEVGVPRQDHDELSKLRSENAELRKLLLRISEQLEQDRRESLLSDGNEQESASEEQESASIPCDLKESEDVDPEC